MDYRVLSPVEITNIIETSDPVKLCSQAISKDNILFYVTNGAQFTKLMVKCKKAILDKPGANGEYYINEIIKNRLIPAVESGDEQSVEMYSMFYKIIVDDYGHIPLLRVTGEKKDTSMHLLFKNKSLHPQLEKLYNLAIKKFSKRQAETLINTDYVNILGYTITPTSPKSCPEKIKPSLLVVNDDMDSCTSSAMTSPTSQTSQTSQTSITPVFSASAPSTPVIENNNLLTGNKSPSACITILKGYETHFFNPNFTSYLKTIKK